MSLKYKIDILSALKERGYNTNVLRVNHLLSESTIQRLRKGEGVSWDNIERLCAMLDCQPGDIIVYEKDGQGWEVPPTVVKRYKAVSTSYRKLFERMKEKGIKKIDLRTTYGLNPKTVDSLVKNQSVTVETIMRLCEILDCQPGDIMEYVKE